MHDQDTRLAASIRDSGFGALLCLTLGFVLLEAWFLALGARPLAHVVLVSIGAVLTGGAWRLLVLPHARKDAGPAAAPWRAVLGALVLPAIFGYGWADAFLGGSLTLFAAFPACACLLPWSRLTLSIGGAALPLGCIAGAGCAVLVTAGRLPELWQFPVAVWMCWLAAALAWVAQLSYRRRSGAPGACVAPPAAPDQAVPGRD